MTTTADDLRRSVEQIVPELVAIRRDLHQHPELAYAEQRTSGVITGQLARLGIAHKAGLARGTGVVAHIPATEGTHAEAVALRADIDALPITETTGLEYASTVPCTMHACGHDGHTAMLLGVARVLSETPRRPRPVTLLFQPAEENGAGGRAMCEDGALDGESALGSGLGPPVGKIFGIHGWPELDLGSVATRPGPLLAATDDFEVTIRGSQAHAAWPHAGRDPIVAAAAVVTALQTLASRETRPTDALVCTVGELRAGTARNVIPGHAMLAGTIRTLEAATRERAEARFRELVEGVARAHGCQAEINWEPGYPVVRNDAALVESWRAVATEMLGADRVRHVEEPVMGGEDFSYYGERVPGCFWLLGLRRPGDTQPPQLHQPHFDFNDDAIATGVELSCRVALGA